VSELVRPVADVPRLGLRPGEAAAALGVSPEFFADRIAAEIPCVRRGALRLYPVSALQRWLDRNARALADDLAGVP